MTAVAQPNVHSPVRLAAQMRNRSSDAGAERLALGHVGRSRVGDARYAARARGAEYIDPCGDRLERRQIDMVPGPGELLPSLCERSRRARTAFADLLHPRRLPDIDLLGTRRRQRRVVRRLRPLALLEVSDAGQQRLVLRYQRRAAPHRLDDLPQQLENQRLHIVRKSTDPL